MSTPNILEGADLVDQVNAHYPELCQGYPYHIERNSVVVDKVDPKTMSASFTVVTRRRKPNRNGHTVQIADGDDGAGIKLDNYRKNPVVLFDHGMSGLALPIGVAESPDGELQFRRLKTKAESTCYFSQRLPEAGLIFALVDEGILRTSSISFLPERAKLNKIKRQRQEGADGEEIIDMESPYYSFDFIQSDLLEWSVVGIPADADAVRKCLDRGQVNGERLTQSLRPALQNMTQGNEPVWSPGWTPKSDAAPKGEELVADAVDVDGILDEVHDAIDELREEFRDGLRELRDAVVPKEPAADDEQDSAGASAAEDGSTVDASAERDKTGPTAEEIAAAIKQGIAPAAFSVEQIGQTIREAFGKA